MNTNRSDLHPVVHDEIILTYDYAVGEIAGEFFQGLRDGRILASHCSASKMSYLPPRAFCERTFEPCDDWKEAGSEGTIEASTIVVRGFEGKRPPPVAIAFVRLDGVDSAIANYVDGIDFSDLDAAMLLMAPGTRVRVKFVDSPEGRITDFSFELIDG
ncbi:DNA-binding protein [Frankia sp. CcI49]|uniref:Zn-ribbon domain-containing OB-fold protein n=1 Tax=Frankia sp. CcI49 TaxID=1745382 RepID=UPI000977CBC2|nr:OB-fold domain-containing protein [Frankia sp. CcI49]ONH60449.1 DNA-binding protein [Frankia sp. CcI49]